MLHKDRLSGYFPAFQDKALCLWSPRSTSPRPLGGSGLCSQFQHLPPCPQVEETAAFWWYNQSEAPMKTAVTRSASFVSFRQCWDFLAAEDDLSLPALFHGRSQKWRSVVCSTGLFPTLQFNLSHSSSLFYKFYILGPFFLRQNHRITSILFIVTTSCEDAKYIGFFAVNPLSYPELGFSLPLRVALHKGNIPHLTNAGPTTKHYVS